MRIDMIKEQVRNTNEMFNGSTDFDRTSVTPVTNILFSIKIKLNIVMLCK